MVPPSLTSRCLKALLVTTAVVLAHASAAGASHPWVIDGKAVHWASTPNPAQIDLGDNLNDPVWSSLRDVPAFVWSLSPVTSGALGPSPYLSLSTRAGGQPGNEVEIYDGPYGTNGWVGQATLESVDSEGHISEATIQLNTSYSLTQSEKHAVLNHEVGHTLGLAHESGTVMCPVLCGIENPVSHDYEVLASVNAHLDGYDTTFGAPAEAPPIGSSVARRNGPRGVVFITRLRNRAVRVVFRDFVSEEAAAAALRG
jgi:hypothetical protein